MSQITPLDQPLLTAKARPPSVIIKLLAILLLFLGLLGYIRLAIHFPLHRSQLRGPKHAFEIIALLAILFALPLIHRPIAAVLDRIRKPTPLARRMMMLAIFIIAIAYLFLNAKYQGRPFWFRIQDEYMYLVQVQAIAHGHLWMPQHPLADFFQEFYVFVHPVTSGMYFPGAAMMWAPAVWLHIPFPALNLLIAGTVVAMTFHVVTELIDAVAGLLAALLLIGVGTFRTLSIMSLSYLPMALLWLTLFWAYLHWRKKPSWLWTILIGVLAGWMAVTRPLDAVVFGAVISIAMLWDIRTSPLPGRWRKAVATILIAGCCAAPFIIAQLMLDHAVTGQYLRTPVQEYETQFWPGAIGGFHPHVRPGVHHPHTSLPQFEDNYQRFVLPHFHLGKHANTPPIPVIEMDYSLPNYLLFLFVPLSILGLRTTRQTKELPNHAPSPSSFLAQAPRPGTSPSPPRLALWLTLPLFLLAYCWWVMYIPYYAVVIAPALMFWIVLGAHELANAFPRGQKFLTVWTSASIAALTIVALPEFGQPDRVTSSPAMTAFHHAERSIHKPAIVFFRYHTEVPGLWRSEQTYNADAAWFDDETIIRAQDLGPRDTELLDYYAAKQPQRELYLFDQAARELTDLGNVAALAAHPQIMFDKMKSAATQPATQPTEPPPKHHRHF